MAKQLEFYQYAKELSPAKKKRLAKTLRRDMNYIYRCISGYNRPVAPLEIEAVLKFAEKNPVSSGIVTKKSLSATRPAVRRKKAAKKASKRAAKKAGGKSK